MNMLFLFESTHLQSDCFCALCRCYRASGESIAPSVLFNGYRMSRPPMSQQHCHFETEPGL
jgi:hypothetical protein